MARTRPHAIATIDDLIEYLRAFHRLWLDDPRLEPAAVPDDLPPGLRRLCCELGGLVELDSEEHGYRTPFAAQDALMEVGRLKRIDDMVEFAWENQGNWSCRFPIGRDDPPVYSNAPDVWQQPARGFQIVCRSLNHFLITLSLQEAVMSCPVLLAADASSIDEVLATPCDPLWLNGLLVYGEPSHDFYEVPGSDVLIMDYAGIWLGSHSDSVSALVKSGVECSRIQ